MSFMSFISQIGSALSQWSSQVFLDRPLGLLALLSLIPFFILYLIKPKPKRYEMPSLMFFMRSKSKGALSSFFRYFRWDSLLLLQLLILLLIALPIASPYIFYDLKVGSKEVVIVLDASASMAVDEGGRTRFERAKRELEGRLGRTNTLILAKSSSLLALKEESAARTRDYLRDLEVSHTPSRLGEAIVLGGQLLGDGDGKLVVVSDFINTDGISAEAARSLAQARGVAVEFVNVGSNDRSNVGIVDAKIGRDESTAYIKNFDAVSRTVTLKIADTQEELSIPAGDAVPYSFQTPQGRSELRLDADDDFPIDNVLPLSTSPQASRRVLLVSSNVSKFLEAALRADPFIDLSIAKPPILPSERFDIYILHNLYPDKLIAGWQKDIYRDVKDGSVVIVYAQKQSLQIGYDDLLPFGLTGLEEGISPIEVIQQTRFTENLEFGSPSYHFTTAGGDAHVVLEMKGDPLLAYSPAGSGLRVYFGLAEDAADFKLSPFYPIFWSELVRFVGGYKDISSLNTRTGELSVSTQTFNSPSGDKREGSFIFDEVGFYSGADTLASALLSEEESSINLDPSKAKEVLEVPGQLEEQKTKFYLERIFIASVLLLLLVELLILRRRGTI